MSDTILGIDLGTSHCRVAVYRGGRPEILPDPRGARSTPSVVTLGDGGKALAGAAAQRQALVNPDRAVTGIKRLLGRAFGSVEVAAEAELAPYEVVAAENGDAWLRVAGKTLSPAEIASHLLEHVHASAVHSLGQQSNRVVITVPGYFDDSQRQATCDAAAIAGLDVMRLVTDATAAALAYGHGKHHEPRCLAVVDLGGGSCEVSIVMVEDGVVEVLGAAADLFLGGRDFDHAVARVIAEEVQRQHGVDPLADPLACQRLLEEVEAAKRQLSDADTVPIALPALLNGPRGVIDVQRPLSRNEFDALTEHLLDRLAEPCLAALSDAGVQATDVDDVLLVGAMSRCTTVRQRIGALFDRPCSVVADAHEGVALGAAIEAGIIAGERDDAAVVDVLAHTVGLRSRGNQMVPLLRRASALPTRVTKLFSTTRDDQEHFDLHVFQGNDALATNNRYLRHVRLEDLPHGPKGSVQLAVTFAVDASGQLSVMARDRASGARATVAVVASCGLSQEDVERLSTARRDRSRI